MQTKNIKKNIFKLYGLELGYLAFTIVKKPIRKTVFKHNCCNLLLFFLGAVFLQQFVKKFDCLCHEESYGKGKEIDNVLILLAHLYNFKVIKPCLTSYGK